MKRTIEHKAFPFEFKVAADEQGIFEGHASVFNYVDSGGDRVKPGFFTKTLAERGHRVKIFFQHEFDKPIGVPLDLHEDGVGLFVKGQLALQSFYGREMWALMKAGVVDELSMGYETIKAEPSDEGGKRVRNLIEGKLYDISPVAVAMNDRATVSSLKSEDSEPAPSELELLLKSCSPAFLELKEGRVLSGANRTLVEKAVEALQALLDAATAAPKSDSAMRIMEARLDIMESLLHS